MSTDMNIDRSSTRVWAPPGGKTSICFGDDAPAKAAAPKNTNFQVPTGRENAAPQQQAAPQQNRRGYNNSSSISFGDDSTPAYVRPAPKQAAPAPTGFQAQQNNGNFQQQQQSNHRVRQAPGGTSSFTLG
jgi:hypothetical protein